MWIGLREEDIWSGQEFYTKVCFNIHIWTRYSEFQVTVHMYPSLKDTMSNTITCSNLYFWAKIYMCSWITASVFNYRRSRIYLIWLSLYTSIPSFNILYPFDTRLQTNTNSMHIRIYFSNFIIIKNYTINIIHKIILYATYIYNPTRNRMYLESLDIESNMNSFDTRRRK